MIKRVLGTITKEDQHGFMVKTAEEKVMGPLLRQ